MLQDEDFKHDMDRGAKFRKHFTISDPADLDKATKLIAIRTSSDEAKKLATYIKENIISEFRSKIRARTFSFGGDTDVSSYEEIVSLMRNAKVVRNRRDGKASFKLVFSTVGMSEKISKGLIKALNSGTGIYNKENPHIIYPKNKKYMFIPGYRFAKTLAMQKSLATGKTYRGTLQNGGKMRGK